MLWVHLAATTRPRNAKANFGDRNLRPSVLSFLPLRVARLQDALLAASVPVPAKPCPCLSFFYPLVRRSGPSCADNALLLKAAIEPSELVFGDHPRRRQRDGAHGCPERAEVAAWLIVVRER